MMKVLLVEGQKDTRRLFEQILVSRGHTVTVCSDGETAWAAYERDPYPLVLTDWGLADSTIDGLQLCWKIRAHVRGSRSIILMTTAQDTPENLMAIRKAGANDYLAKSMSLECLKMRLLIAEQWAIAESAAMDAAPGS